MVDYLKLLFFYQHYLGIFNAIAFLFATTKLVLSEKNFYLKCMQKPASQGSLVTAGIVKVAIMG